MRLNRNITLNNLKINKEEASAAINMLIKVKLIGLLNITLKLQNFQA